LSSRRSGALSWTNSAPATAASRVGAQLSRSGAASAATPRAASAGQAVAISSRSPRDGRFLEKLGIYNPLLPSDSPERVVLSEERVRYWLANGAKPSDRVARFLDGAGITSNTVKFRGTGKKAREIEAKKAAAAESAGA